MEPDNVSYNPNTDPAAKQLENFKENQIYKKVSKV
jgi:hypothetical protein